MGHAIEGRHCAVLADLHEVQARRARLDPPLGEVVAVHIEDLVAVDVTTNRVFVNDRDNNRVQIFDENGKYLSEWKITVRPSSLHFVVIGDDRKLVTFDRNTHKMLKYELDGRLIYSWGTQGDFPGTLWGVHGMATDQEGNLYVAEVDAGRFQKFRPRPGANPAALLGKPIYSAWR